MLRCATPSIRSRTPQAAGVRHPFTSLLPLTFLGLLCRETDFAGLQRWASDHWQTLKDPLGFTQTNPPHATTISRVLTRFSLEQFRDAFARWLVSLPQIAEAVTAAVDGKTSKQGHDAQGDPVHMLNVFAHELKLSLAQFPVTDGKPTEPQALKAGLAELLEHYPFLRLFTADALFAQRPLARVILEADRDFLFGVKDNQPDLLEAIEASFQDAAERPPDAETREKNSLCGCSRGRRAGRGARGGWCRAPRCPPPGRSRWCRASRPPRAWGSPGSGMGSPRSTKAQSGTRQTGSFSLNWMRNIPRGVEKSHFWPAPSRRVPGARSPPRPTR